MEVGFAVASRRGAAALLLCAMVAVVHAARSENLAVFPKDAVSYPAVRYAALDAATCKGELTKRGVPFADEPEPAPGVLIPVRLTGALHGVLFRTALPESARKTSPWEVYDCRLVLALDDFSAILQAHQIDEVVMFSAWRPPPKTWPEGKLADRHAGGLAADLQKFHEKSGAWLVVEKDYHGRVHSQTCGKGRVAPKPETAGARELRAIVCEASDAHVFNAILTPNYNRPHRNHFHVEVKPGVTWFLTR